jgi:hypothetical protein
MIAASGLDQFIRMISNSEDIIEFQQRMDVKKPNQVA